MSAAEAVEYANSVYDKIPTAVAVIALLLFFMVLNLAGVTESAVVAVYILTTTA